MGLKKIVRYTCSTKVSSFIPMVLNAVATVLLVISKKQDSFCIIGIYCPFSAVSAVVPYC